MFPKKSQLKLSSSYLGPAEVQKLQNKIYQKMSPKKKLEITSEFILLAKKLASSQTISKEQKRK